MADTPTTVIEWTLDNVEVDASEIKQNGVHDQSKLHVTEDAMEEPFAGVEGMEVTVEKTDGSSMLDLTKIPKLSIENNFKSLMVALQLMFLANFCGMSTIQLHMVKFYEAGDTSTDENYVFLLIDKIKLGGSIASLVMIVLVTRKNLLYFSYSTMALSLMAIGSFFFIKNENPDIIAAGHQWIPLALSIVFIIGYSVGIGSIVWLVMAEILPGAYRDILSTIATSFHWICIYGIFVLFKNNRGKSLLYTDVLFWMHGFICIYGIIFVKSCVPDIHGCSLEDLIGILTAES